jgi:photosystem II stability/assembly factor-like uncharacterized protein
MGGACAFLGSPQPRHEEKGMKRLLLVATAVILAACNSATATPSAAPAAQPALPGPWKIVSQKAADPTMAMYQAGFLDETHGVTVGYNGEVHYTTDGGKTWPAGANQSLCRFGLDVVSAQVAWHCGNGGIGFSSDGGRTWTNVKGTYNTSDSYPCHLLSFLDARTGWAANDSDLARIDNGGDTSTEITLPAGLGGSIAAIDMRTAADGYVLDSSRTVWVTADGGKTWTSKPLGLTGDAIATSKQALAGIHFSDATHGVVVARLAGTAPKLVAVRTSDGGATWQTEQIGLVFGSGDDTVSLYLAHDGVSLTVLDTLNTITLLRYQP